MTWLFHYEVLRGFLWFAKGDFIEPDKAYEYFTAKAIRSLLKDGYLKVHYKKVLPVKK